MKFEVSFVQNRTYEVDAENEQETEKKAYEKFHEEMSYPVAHTNYDEIIIEPLDEF